MADTNKAEKLAAARKKLKEFQQRNRQSPSVPQLDRADISSPGSVTSQNSIEYKPPSNEIISPEGHHLSSEPQLSLPDYGIQQPVAYDSNYASQANFYNEGLNSAAQQHQNYMPYYDNEAQNSVGFVEELPKPNNDARKYSNSYGYSPEWSAMIAQIAEKDTTIASLQNQLQTLQLAPNLSKQQELQNALHDLEQQWGQRVKELEEQLRLHTQTVNILVAEKSEYQASLAKTSEVLKIKSTEADDAQALVKVVQQKLSERESALAAAMQEQTTKHQIFTDSQKRCDELTAELQKVERERNEQRQQANQLQQRISVTMQQVSMLQTELQEKQSQLTSTQVRLKQLGGSLKETDDSSIVDDLKIEREKSLSLEQQIADLKSDFAEKEQASNQYQQFVHQLNQQLSTVATKLQEASQENEKLKEQNEQMVEHVSILESRLNKASQLNSHVPSAPDTVELDKVKEDLKKALEENSKLKSELDTQELEKATYEESMLRYQEMIRRLEEERPDERKLMAAMESDRVAAQRATAQNTKLKDQLLEMEQMKAQMIEQLHTFEARARQAQSLQQCLIDAQNEIKNLKNQINQKNEEQPESNHVNGDETSNEDDTTLSPEATQKLQFRFTDVMRKLADTSDEKQKLEHLVMQLQGETETIGEYVALYQQQRCLLRERAAEKDREIERMATDREELVLKLKQVGHLVLQLVNGQRENNSVPLTEPKDYETVALEIADQVTGLLNKMEESSQVSKPLSDEELLELHDQRNALSLNQETMLPCPCCSGRLEIV